MPRPGDEPPPPFRRSRERLCTLERPRQAARLLGSSCTAPCAGPSRSFWSIGERNAGGQAVGGELLDPGFRPGDDLGLVAGRVSDGSGEVSSAQPPRQAVSAAASAKNSEERFDTRMQSSCRNLRAVKLRRDAMRAGGAQGKGRTAARLRSAGASGHGAGAGRRGARAARPRAATTGLAPRVRRALSARRGGDRGRIARARWAAGRGSARRRR